MGLKDYYDNYATQPRRWADEDDDFCPCHGGGWWLSELDTWHKCPYHFRGQEHPEYLGEEEDGVEEENPAPNQPSHTDDIPF